MNSRTITMTGAIAAVLLLCLAGPVVLLAGAAGTLCGPPANPPATDAPGSSQHWDDEQIANATTIVTVGAGMHIPPRGWIIAVATAMQESGLRNLGHLGARNDHDSLGLFQQRPSQGWGTPQQLTDPQYAARAFYQKLLTVDGWQTMPLAQAAQAVQHSAYPQAYQPWETEAAHLVQRIASGSPSGMQTGPDDCAATPSEHGWLAPVQGPIVSGFRTPQRPTHQGVDIAAPRGTTIRAAATGTVLTARCNVVPASHGCDQDGSPHVQGCGWYVNLQHAAGVITRYCHMQTQPLVHEGQTVVVGQPLGLVGSSGHSSGPHLHYETHLGGDRTPNGAVDPIQFMVDVGAPLGEAS